MPKQKHGLLLLVLLFIWLVPSVAFAQQLDPELRDLIDHGLGKSHKIRLNNLDIDQARLDQQLARAVFNPKLTYTGSFTRLNDDITLGPSTERLLLSTQKLLIKEALGIPFNVPLPDNVPLQPVPNLQDKGIFKSSLDLEWVLFSGLKATNAIRASEHKVASLNYRTEVQKDETAMKIIETYDQLALVNASRKVLTTSEEYLNEQKYYVNKAIENGLTTPIDRKKIELAQQRLEGKLLDFKQKKTLLVEVLHQLTNVSRQELRSLQPELNPFVVALLPGAEKRNEIKALEEARQAVYFQGQIEKGNRIPQVAARARYEILQDDLSLLDPEWYVGIGVQWNILDGSESSLKRHKLTLEGLKYATQKEEAEEMIALSVVNAELEYESSLQQIEMAKKEIELALETYDMVYKQYRNDLTSINDVLDALNEVEKSKFKLQESYFNQRRAVISLLHAQGRLNY